MELRQRHLANVVDFSSYRAARQQRTLWDQDAEPPAERPTRGAAPALSFAPSLKLSERQVAHRQRMLAFLLVART